MGLIYIWSSAVETLERISEYQVYSIHQENMKNSVSL